ncbi:hypothetical protein DL98DRAFT_515813 [Cadophora sp. DSE1049]|nr:hypothetical protein DL98DRAFT_515813 [Cadophora sp. DSE1049]
MKGECGCSGTSSCKSFPLASLASRPLFTPLSTPHRRQYFYISRRPKQIETNIFVIGNCGSSCSCSSCGK